MRVAGIMSGTSLDGIDVAVVDIGEGLSLRTVAFTSTPYPVPLRKQLLAVSNNTTHTREISRLHYMLPELYAMAVIEACNKAGIPLRSLELIGCHGQTIFHETKIDAAVHPDSTLQIGEAAVLAERTGVPVVSNFRARDMAAGGKGAPLVPYMDYLLFRDAQRGRIALNLGGIANITALPPDVRPEQVVAFDTGPANMVIDQLVERHTAGRETFDRGGQYGAQGRVREELLAQLLEATYYSVRPPKSAGREQYGREFVDGLVATGLPLLDLIATATALTAHSVVSGIERFGGFVPHDLIAAGGGVHNTTLMAGLARLLPQTRVTTTAEWGIDPDAKEAIAFAVLAHETWHRRPGNLPAATGARRAVVLGDVTY